MLEIEFSSMLDPNPSLGLGDDFYGAFTSQNQIKVKRRHIDWLNAWDELVKIGLSSKGPDISEIGSTWLGVGSMQWKQSARSWHQILVFSSFQKQPGRHAQPVMQISL